MEYPKDKKIVLFDGVCNLCNGAVQYIIKRDKKDQFRFAALQSEIGQFLASERQIDLAKTDSIILIEPGLAYYIKSSAALRIGLAFGGPYKILALYEWIPRPIRDFVYDIIAKRRYRWFGKQDECMIPTPELKNKFLD
ncbi:MAG: thiol-disulfide oxidoreductase DCC family protein [Flavobacteriaceae bacterium]